jgi:hypothetical protein
MATRARAASSTTRRRSGYVPVNVVYEDRHRGQTGQGNVIAGLVDGCPAAPGWVAYWGHLTLPLTGQELADAQATVAGWDDPNIPQGGLGDCWGCAAQVARLRVLVDQATRPSGREDGTR